MATARRLRDGLLSLLCFGGVMAALVAYDPRVRARVAELAGTADTTSVPPLADRLSMLASVIWTAVRDQSLEHAPLVLFAVAGAVLLFFMLRT
ncbi:MAG TPA: hypothetical protein VNI83_13325 [Vicinamibacterales bacterium]|nr:hypothetical protein [Vicinamibacterales bacterium]